jgi:multicomponent K+:H+ antiporter subunit D
VTLSAFLLLSVPGLPLLLTIPFLRLCLPWPGYLALLPAVALLVLPHDVFVELPWLLLGSGLGIGGASRSMLAMSVVLWTVAATLSHTVTLQPTRYRFTTFFLLTMAGHLGAILATDLVGFFAFSTLMGYGFYGLLVDGGDQTARRAGRVYLGLLILADLLLFEALLIAAATTEDLGFETVRHAMARSPESGLYLAMVLAGFALKVGVWPLHFWLPLAFRSARPAVALLVGGVPLGIGLLGAVRWSPLGEITLPDLGLIIQGMGVAAVVYAILAGLIQAQLKKLPAYAAIITTGLFATVLGAGLGDPAAWKRYANLAHFFVVSLGLGLAVLVTAIRWLEARYPYPATPAKRTDDSSPWFERWSGVVVRWGQQMGFDTLPRLRASWLANVGRLRQVCAWHRASDAGEWYLQRWALAVTLVLLLGIAVVLVAAA